MWSCTWFARNVAPYSTFVSSAISEWIAVLYILLWDLNSTKRFKCVAKYDKIVKSADVPAHKTIIMTFPRRVTPLILRYFIFPDIAKLNVINFANVCYGKQCLHIQFAMIFGVNLSEQEISFISEILEYFHLDSFWTFIPAKYQ